MVLWVSLFITQILYRLTWSETATMHFYDYTTLQMNGGWGKTYQLPDSTLTINTLPTYFIYLTKICVVVNCFTRYWIEKKKSSLLILQCWRVALSVILRWRSLLLVNELTHIKISFNAKMLCNSALHCSPPLVCTESTRANFFTTDNWVREWRVFHMKLLP